MSGASSFDIKILCRGRSRTSVLILTAAAAVMTITNLSTTVFADPAHCDQSGWTTCYSVGYSDGQQNPNTPCPSGHSASFCDGWNAAANSNNGASSSNSNSNSNSGSQGGSASFVANSAHCDSPGWPSCYDVGHASALGNSGPCPNGHSSEFCGGWDAATSSSSSSSSSSSGTSSGPDYGSEGSNGDYTCQVPVQPGPGCPNDQPSHHSGSQHHTSEYLQGYKTGQIDGRTGIYDPGSCCPGMNEVQIQHWLQGYHDGYKSICGTTYSRQNPSCNSPPT